MENEDFTYAFDGSYDSKFDEIEDEEFHLLRAEWLAALNKFKAYMGVGYESNKG